MRNHTLPYSCMGLIEMNMAHFYPEIYWNCACLSINASANEDVEDNGSTSYGKIAKAIGDMQNRGIRVVCPEINSAKFGFYPNVEKDEIIFGLKGINGIGDDIAIQIIKNRPYSGVMDFCAKNPNVGPKAVITLIKAGAFDLMNCNRIRLMSLYVNYIAKQKTEFKTSLTMQNFSKAFDLGVIPQQFNLQARLLNFKKYVFNKQYLTDIKDHYLLDSSARLFFDSELQHRLSEGVEYKYYDDDIVIVKKPFEKWLNSFTKDLKEWIASKEATDLFNRTSVAFLANDIWDKYCSGNIAHWEMESLSFYYTEHELACVNNSRYGIVEYKNIPEQPEVVDEVERVNKKTGIKTTYPKYRLYTIAGTVLDKNANKNYITLLTTTGVVTVKFYNGSFTYYDKQISKKNPVDGKKTVIEKSWFQRGNLLLITGIRRGDMFFPKRYTDTIYQHTLRLIEKVNHDGSLSLKFERERTDE